MARTDTLPHFLTDVADAIREKTGSTGTITASDFDTEIENIPSGGAKLFTGHYDSEGLATIGWSNAEIQYYQDYGVQWNEEQDDIFKLNELELTGQISVRFLPKNYSTTSFGDKNRLLALPIIDTSSVTNFANKFQRCYSLKIIPLLNTSKGTLFNGMFNNCYSLETIPLLDTSKGTAFNNMFQNCYSLKTIPLLDTSKGTATDGMFYNCYSLKTIPQLDTSSSTNFGNMFNGCYSLCYLPQLNTSKGTTLSSMFYNCSCLSKIPQLDTSKGTTLASMFAYCSVLTEIPELDASSSKSFSSMFQNCVSLKDFGGLKNAGEAYLTSVSASYSSYTITLSSCTLLTHDSLMNVINNLYDIATKGVQPQKLVLGSTNLAKLTAEEIAIATNKGWTVS